MDKPSTLKIYWSKQARSYGSAKSWLNLFTRVFERLHLKSIHTIALTPSLGKPLFSYPILLKAPLLWTANVSRVSIWEHHLKCVSIAAVVISKITLPTAIKMREPAKKSESHFFFKFCVTLLGFKRDLLLWGPFFWDTSWLVIQASWHTAGFQNQSTGLFDLNFVFSFYFLQFFSFEVPCDCISPKIA